MVVDDIDDNRFLIKAYLKKQGLDVVEAVHGLEALELTQKEFFDLIFMDVHMPVMDGYAATRKIRQQQNGQEKHTLIIALSANALSEDILASVEAGCDDYIAKPIRKDFLYSMLNKYFGENS